MTKIKTMQQILIIIALLTGVLQLNTSCCHEQDDNSGAILTDYKIGADYFYPHCLTTPDTACIRDDSSYRESFIIDTTCYNAKNLTLPTIDFSKYSLLVNRKFWSGRVYFQRNVTVDSINKIVTYQITTTSCFCPDKCESFALNIVIVPRISNDYKVIYK
jgi:hypothetical protein